MGFVKGIGGEGGHLVEDFVGHRCRHTAADTAVHLHLAILGETVDENLPLLLHHVVLFLRHGAAYQVCATEGVARQRLQHLHHLLLIHDAPVGDLEDRLQQGMGVLDPLGVAAVFDVAGDGVHRTGAVEGNHRDEILESGGAQLHQHPLEAARLHLEYAVRFALGQHLIHPLVVQRNVRHGERGRVFLNHFLCVGDHRQVAQAEEIHLEDTQLLQVIHGVLGGHRLVIHTQRHVLADGAGGNHHAGGVGRGVAGESLHLLRHLDEHRHLGVAVPQVAELATLAEGAL